MNDLLTQDSAYRQALVDARRLHRSGAGTVLDVLMRGTAPADLPALFAWLQAHAGVRAAPDPRAVLAGDAPVILGAVAQQLYQTMSLRGDGGKDFSAIVEGYRKKD